MISLLVLIFINRSAAVKQLIAFPLSKIYFSLAFGTLLFSDFPPASLIRALERQTNKKYLAPCLKGVILNHAGGRLASEYTFHDV